MKKCTPVKILILGAGGREHALAWRLANDPDRHDLVISPGNPGLSGLGRLEPADLLNPDAVVRLAEAERVDLTVVGPEAPLEKGLADRFRAAGRPLLGPSREGALLETSKSHAKRFMERLDIPTARFVVCRSAGDALGAVAGDQFGFPVVVKADGLAAGKGVTVAADRAEAEAAIRTIMVDRQFGAAGDEVVIEECLTGPEVSMFYLLDGTTAVYLGSAQDHKRIFDDDRGPNTGGMGAFAPSPLVDDALERTVRARIVDRVLQGHRDAGEPYIGFLYVSLMLTPRGPYVIEFNVRFGDPEAQVVLPLIEGDFGDLLKRAATGRLAGAVVQRSADVAVGVVLASRGYPASSESGVEIRGLEAAKAVPGVIVFHAGTRLDDGRLVTAGGRVLTVVARAADFQPAMDAAYRAADLIEFDGRQMRRDIGRKALV
jgi:phosphoribosylamine--glycine ligase